MWARDPKLRGDKYDMKSDSEIREAVKDALFYDARVDVLQHQPGGPQRHRHAAWPVDNLKAKRAAEMDAKNTVGVWSVENRIKVRPAEDILDQSIESRVINAMLRHPVVESYEITVDFKNGNTTTGG